ncbi:MAG: SMP-30/gluconolactonase/LRE family protein, partial [Ostreibacterium sp.]
MTIEILNDDRDLLGESPFWDEKSNSLWWVDIIGNRIKCLHFNETKEGISSLKTWKTADLPTSLALCTTGEVIVSFCISSKTCCTIRYQENRRCPIFSQAK